MSRVALVALLGAALLVPVVSAQATDASFTFDPQSTATATTNGTFVSRAFDVALSIAPGVCPTGGTVTVGFSTSVAGGNGSVAAEVNPPSLVYSLGVSAGAGLAGARTFGTEVAVVVSTSQLVTATTNATVTVTATPTFSGCAPMSAPTLGAQNADVKVSFVPNDAFVAANQPSEIVPGVELPLLALGLLGAILVARRRQA